MKVFIEKNGSIIGSFDYEFNDLPNMLNIIKKNNKKYQIIEILYKENSLKEVKVQKYFK
jgi:hypothetical protein